MLPLPVIYTNLRPKSPWRVAFQMNDQTQAEATRAFIMALLTKDKVWEYEREWRLMISSTMDESPAETLQFLADFLSKDLGVEFTRAQMERFCELYTNLNNHSHLWLNCGWRPAELRRREPLGFPESISIGPNMKELFEEGEMQQDIQAFL